jgi:hypothetical protein
MRGIRCRDERLRDGVHIENTIDSVKPETQGRKSETNPKFELQNVPNGVTGGYFSVQFVADTDGVSRSRSAGRLFWKRNFTFDACA